MEHHDFEKEVVKVEKEIHDFERSLRTSFNKHNPNNHLVIQRVHVQCLELKKRVDELINNANIQRKPKAISLKETALFYTNKFEDAVRKCIPLNWDILMELWKQKK